jgi:tryptophan synthase alpha subunit
MTNISKVFQKLKTKKEGALIAYVMGGDPEPKYTPKIAEFHSLIPLQMA